MMAAIAIGNISKPKIPVNKLARAFPLVSPASIGSGATGGGAVPCSPATAVTDCPQRVQNWLFSGSVAPHFEQNITDPFVANPKSPDNSPACSLALPPTNL